jgi:hypothetical protein
MKRVVDYIDRDEKAKNIREFLHEHSEEVLINYIFIKYPRICSNEEFLDFAAKQYKEYKNEKENYRIS